jgi:hypothetical protein
MLIRDSQWTFRAAAAVAAALALIMLLPGSAQAAGGGDGCNPNRPNNFLTYYFSGEYGSAPGTTAAFRPISTSTHPGCTPSQGLPTSPLSGSC